MLVKDVKDVLPYFMESGLDVIGLDTESSGLNAHQDVLLLIQISTRDENFVFNVGELEEKMLRYLLDLILSRGIKVVSQNSKHDLKFIYHNYGILFTNIHDTMLAEALIFAGLGKKYQSLDKLALKYLNVKMDKDDRETFIGKTDFSFTENQILYAERDASVLIPIMEGQLLMLETKKQMKALDLEMRLEPVVAMMEYTGIPLDTKKWMSLYNEAIEGQKEYEMQLNKILFDNFDKIAGKYSNALEALENVKYSKSKLKVKYRRKEWAEIVVKDEIKAYVIPMINMNSHIQALHVLKSLGVPAKNTDAKDLEAFREGFEVVDVRIKYKFYAKRVGTYGEDFLKHIDTVTGFVHTQLQQLGAATGRFSSGDPNMQNIIAEESYRASFIARPGYLFGTTDYSNIELRIMGEVSKEPAFIDAFNEGKDFHTETASLVFQVPYEEVTKKQRTVAKSLNFGLIYGISAKGIARNFGIPLSEGQELLDNYFIQFPTLEFFITHFGNMCLEKGYSTSIMGRKRFLSFAFKPRNQQEYGELGQARRIAVNHIAQGTSADMIKLALIQMWYNNPFGYENFRPVLTVHDEIVVEFKEEIKEEAEEFIGKCMQEAGEAFLKIVPIGYSTIIDNCWRKD